MPSEEWMSFLESVSLTYASYFGSSALILISHRSLSIPSGTESGLVARAPPA